MPEIGQLWKDSRDQVHVYVWTGSGPVVHPRWVCLNQHVEALPETLEQLRALPQGTVIDPKALPRVVVVRAMLDMEKATRMDDETFAALLEEAEHSL